MRGFIWNVTMDMRPLTKAYCLSPQKPNEQNDTHDERQLVLNNSQETKIHTILDFKAEAGYYYYLLEFSDGTQKWTPATGIIDSETLAYCLAKLLERKYGLQTHYPCIKSAKPFIPEDIIGIRGGKETREYLVKWKHQGLSSWLSQYEIKHLFPNFYGVYFKSQAILDKETVSTQPTLLLSTTQPTSATSKVESKKTPKKAGKDESKKESEEFLCAEITKFWENL